MPRFEQLPVVFGKLEVTTCAMVYLQFFFNPRKVHGIWSIIRHETSS